MRMFFGLTSPWTSATACACVVATRRAQRRRQVGMALRGGQQVGLEPDVEEDRVGRELRREFGARRRVAVDARQHAADRARGRRVARGRRAGSASTAGSRSAAGSSSRARPDRGAGRAPAARSPGGPALATCIQRASYRLRSIGACQSAATRSLGSARLAQTGPCAVSMRQMSDDTPPVSGRPHSGQRIGQPEFAQGLREFGRHRPRRLGRVDRCRVRLAARLQAIKRRHDPPRPA